MSNATPLPGLSDRFSRLILMLCGVLATYSRENRAAQPMIHVIFMGLRRRMARFTRLVARFEAGTLPTPRPARPRAARPAAADAAPPCTPAPSNPGPSKPAPSKPAPLNAAWFAAVALVRLPRRKAWLPHLVPPTGAYCSWFRDLVLDPQTATLLAASPEAGRLLRGLWRMIGVHPMPDVLRLPPRSRPPTPVASLPSDAVSAEPARPDQPFAETPRPLRKRRGFYRPRSGPLFSA